MSDSTNALSNSFDNGLGTLGNAWNVDQSVPGQITLAGSASVMEWATGPAAGHGYGTYTIEAQVNGNQPGPAIILWPGDNNWPGQEIDLMEITPNGNGAQYSTLHWNQWGSDAYTPQVYSGVTNGVPHEYQMVWEPGKITMVVDGQVQASYTNHVPADFAHGGMNDTIGFLNNNAHTSLTVFSVDFTPLGTATAAPPASTVAAIGPAAAMASPVNASPANSSAAPIDWQALGAQAEANFAATGIWFLNDTTTAAGPAAPHTDAVVDWNALAAQVEATYAATGSWHL
jgi:hypothetical protein